MAWTTTFLKAWAAYYALMVVLYLVTGAVVTWVNRHLLSHLRIQARTCPPDLVRRDVAQSLRSLVSIAAFLAMGESLHAAGFGHAAAGQSLLAKALSLLASLVLFDTWFYWGHRLLHSDALYDRAHAWHHRVETPTVWNNYSDTLLDNVILQGYWLVIHILLPIQPGVVLLHKVYDQVTGMLGHAGYEYAPGAMSRFPSLLIGTTFHDDHHKLFRVNFATHFSFWDRLCGTIDPEYDRKIDAITARARAR